MHVRMTGISKRFGSTQALDGMDFEARAGEVTALLGENGAGKSTLMKVLYGLQQPDAGTLHLDGEAVRLPSPRAALARGIGMVFQQFSLVPALTVRENLALSGPDHRAWIGLGARRLADIDRHLARVAPGLDPSARVETLSVGERQLAELARVLSRPVRCLVLDEPSATLSPTDAQALWQRVRTIAASGLSVVLITHKLADVRACADRVQVMRAGRAAGDGPVDTLDDAAIVRAMVGHLPPLGAPRTAVPPQAPERLSLRGLCAGPLQGITLSVRAGEVLGVAGVAGNGQTALAEVVAGLRAPEAGELAIDGRPRRPDAHGAAMAGIGWIPELPLVHAVAGEASAAVNLSLRRFGSLPWRLSPGALEADAAELMARFDVRPRDPALPVRTLSGGNLQKLVIARELSPGPGVVVACHPTMGLDVDASAQVYRTLFDLARSGSAVLWFSEDLDDLRRHAHRIAVMVRGRIVGLFDAATVTLPELGAAMTGMTDAVADRAEGDATRALPCA